MECKDANIANDKFATLRSGGDAAQKVRKHLGLTCSGRTVRRKNLIGAVW